MSHGTRCEVLGSSEARDASAERLKRYALAAGGVVATVGAVSDASHAAVVTSSGSGPLWSGTVNGSNASINAFTYRANSIWGDSLLNGRLFAWVSQAGKGTTSSWGRVLQMGADGAGDGRVGVARLASGAVIGATGSIFNLPRAFVSVISDGFTGGSWSARPGAFTEWSFGSSNSVRGYLAFRLANGSGDFNYGYVDVEFARSGQAQNSTFTLTVHGWAYESTVGQSITIGGAAAVPGGAGLAALAFGAAGLRGRRRSRN